jgi:hypothetical protein
MNSAVEARAAALSRSIVLANPWKQDATAFPSRLIKLLARNPLP